MGTSEHMVESLLATRRWWGPGNCSFVKVLQKSGSILVVVLTDKLKGHTLRYDPLVLYLTCIPLFIIFFLNSHLPLWAILTWFYRLILLILPYKHIYIHTWLWKLKKKKKQLLKVLFFAIFIGRNLDFYCTVGLYNTKYPQNKKPLNLLFKREGEVFPFKPLSACRWRVFFRSFTLLNLICAFVARIPTFRRQICLLRLPAALEN